MRIPDLLTCLLSILMICLIGKVSAQKIEYSSENVFTNYPDRLQLIGNISGNHHLLSIVYNEEPVIFIFDEHLDHLGKVNIPYKFPEKAEIRIVPFDDYYYFYIHPQLTSKYLLWKIDGKGNMTDMTEPLVDLLYSQSRNIKLGFQLIRNEEELWLVYHTDLTNREKNTLVIVQTDSLLRPLVTHKVMYDFKREVDKLHQENIMFGRYLLVLKSSRGGTALELMKVNLATGYSISNTFNSSGYTYSQAVLNYNHEDSTVTVSALLTEPRLSVRPKRFVFLSRMNKILIEQVPLSVLRLQFLKNTNTNFTLVDGGYKWIRLRTERMQTYSPVYETNTVSLYQDLTMPDLNYQQLVNANNNLLAKVNPVSPGRSVRYYSYADDPSLAIRFSLLDKNFKINQDTLMPNNKNAHTIQSDQFCSFSVSNKYYLLVGQRFYRKSYGLLMVNSNDENRLTFTNVQVNDRNNYLLSKAQVIPKMGIVVPYTSKRETGLIKITID